MSVIASNSVNFVPIHQLLKNFTEINTGNGIPDEGLTKATPKEIFDVAELSVFNKVGQGGHSNPISSEQSISDNSIGKSAEIVAQEKVLEIKQNQLDAQSASQNIDSVRSFIVEGNGKAMAQQANQSKQSAIFLI